MSRGFTLVELVVCIVVGSIISGTAGMLLWTASSQRGDVAARGELADQGAMAMEVMARYVREIAQGDDCPSNPTPCLNGKAQISTASASQINFGNTGFRYLAGNGKVEMTANNGATWQTLTKDVTGFSVTYYERTGLAMMPLPLSAADCEDVRRVQITLDLARGTQSVKLQTSLYLRSFMDEVTTDP
jgi:prepilin-type N-terminal cleavage/methylation domain-containing protein